MKIKDDSVQCEFHSILTAFLFQADVIYRIWGTEITITSGSEPEARHGLTSLHYATPACGVDIRSWDIKFNGSLKTAQDQVASLELVRDQFCTERGIPPSWIEIILEKDHIHIEYQPKRQEL